MAPGRVLRRLAAGAVTGVAVLGIQLLLNPGQATTATVWVPALLAGSAVILALVASGRVELRSPPAPGLAAAGEPTLLSFGAMPEGGIQSRAEGLRRLEDELALAQEYGRPLGLAILGLDAGTGDPDLEDTMLGLEEIAYGAMRTSDIIFKTGPTELVLLLPETATEAARGVVGRIQSRSAELGTVRAALAWADGAETASAALEELESGLELCRLSGRLTADPFHLLA